MQLYIPSMYRLVSTWSTMSRLTVSFCPLTISEYLLQEIYSSRLNCVFCVKKFVRSSRAALYLELRDEGGWGSEVPGFLLGPALANEFRLLR